MFRLDETLGSTEKNARPMIRSYLPKSSRRRTSMRRSSAWSDGVTRKRRNIATDLTDLADLNPFDPLNPWLTFKRFRGRKTTESPDCAYPTQSVPCASDLERLRRVSSSSSPDRSGFHISAEHRRCRHTT